MRGTKWKCDADRFWSKVDRRGPDECWPWLASTREGYGQFKVGGKKGRMAKAHRLSWEMHFGAIPKSEDSLHGSCVCHRCDNPLCVNPAHLFIGTQRQNVADRTSKLRTGRKLDPSAVEEIRRRSARGEQQKEIAASVGTSRANVGMVLSGKTWAWLQ